MKNIHKNSVLTVFFFSVNLELTGGWGNQAEAKWIKTRELTFDSQVSQHQHYPITIQFTFHLANHMSLRCDQPIRIT